MNHDTDPDTDARILLAATLADPGWVITRLDVGPKVTETADGRFNPTGDLVVTIHLSREST